MSSRPRHGNAQPVNERTPLLASVNANDAQETQLEGVVSNKQALPGRQVALDLLRGLLMVLMAIDHTSVSVGAYAHGTGIVGEKASLIITRWNDDLPYAIRTLTHLCAPGFSFLLGVGIAYFVESRMKQGMLPLQFAKHFSLRALAMVLVNAVAFPFIFFAQPRIVILNIVMWALAIDYLLVGALCLLLAFTVEPLLSDGIQRLLVSRNKSSSESERRELAERASSHIINLFLLVAATVSLWSNIWVSPNQGECRSAVSTLKWSMTPTEHCKLDRHFFFDVFFGQAVCPNLAIITSFPPMGWLSFALYGLLYGRILIRSRFGSSLKVVSFNATLAVVFAFFFVSTRLLSYGNLSTNCLHTPDQIGRKPSSNQYLASLKSFFYIVKYSPSPAFAFFSLSGCCLLIAIFASLMLYPTFAQIIKHKQNPLLIFGNQPLFFYGAHLFFLQLIGTPLRNSSLGSPMPDSPDENGIGLGWAFALTYLIVLAVMYLACWQYSKFKLRMGRESVLRFL